MINMALTLVGIVFGGLITFVVARYYYIRAAKELKDVADEILSRLEEDGLVKISRDKHGKITGYAQTATAMTAHATATAGKARASTGQSRSA